ncbi:MAG: CPBP family intramembrane metalloprotease [Planctomycetes bacterium]|nr:CPBP family intramembrane metalloprotease [Planctomycetota bacterium]
MGPIPALAPPAGTRRRDIVLVAGILAFFFACVTLMAWHETRSSEPAPKLGEDPPLTTHDRVKALAFLIVVSIPAVYLLGPVGRRVFVRVREPASPFRFLDIVLIVSASFLLLVALAGLVHSLLERFRVPELARIALYQVAQNLWQVAVWVLLPLVLLALRRSGPRAMGLLPDRWGRILLGAFLAWILFVPIFFLSSFSVETIHFLFGKEVEAQEILNRMRDRDEGGYWSFLICATLTACFVAPVVEEFFFRGVLYSSLRRRLRPLPAMAVSAFLFSLVHWPISTWPSIYILGLVLAYAYERSGSLAAPIALHALHNIAVMSYMLFLIFA